MRFTERWPVDETAFGEWKEARGLSRADIANTLKMAPRTVSIWLAPHRMERIPFAAWAVLMLVYEDADRSILD